MPIYVKSGSYTLGESFVAGGGIYANIDATNLRLWARLRSTPVDESGNGITVSYTGSPVASGEQIPTPQKSKIPDLPAATFDGTSDNAAVAATSFLDFSGDVPFSVACWIIKPSDGSSAVIFEMPNVGNTASGWGALVSSTASVAFALSGTGGGKVVASTNAAVLPEDEWVHLTITYDGSKSGLGISIYINGKRVPVFDGSSGTFTTVDADGSRELKLFANFDASSRTAGSLSEFAIWSSVLVPSAVRALYNSTAGRYSAKSGIVSLPNRVRIGLEDNEAGSYPNQLRTTGRIHDKGNTASIFDDTVTQVFKSFDNSLYPMVNPERQLEKLNTSRLIPTPNQNSNIEITSTSKPATSTQGTFIDSTGEISNTPFDESKIFLKDKSDQFYASGTAESDYPGYGSPLRDKIVLKIPINNKQEKTITRYSGYHMPNDSEGMFSNTFRSTGFYYYNFSNSVWQDVGLESTTSMFYTGSGGTVGNLSSVSLGSKIRDAQGFIGPASETSRLPKLQQFKMSDHMGVFIDSVADSRTSKPFPYSDLTSSLAYHLIGAPTESGLAPWHQRYHATGSQTIKISDYITGELALEKVVLDIPVVVQRMRGSESGGGNSGERFYDSCRDVDNYMFFLYRQKRPIMHDRVDNAYAASGSRRELICSGAAAFYNSNAFSGRVPELVRKNGLPHTPSFSHDFNAASATGGQGSTSIISAFTGSIRVEMKVATPTGQPAGGSRFPLAGEESGATRLPANGNTYHRSTVVQDWWPGGRTNPSASNVTNSSLCTATVAPLIFRNHSTYFAGLKPFAASQDSATRDAKKDDIGVSKIGRSPRSFVNHEGSSYFENFDYDELQTRGGFTSGKPNGRNSGILGYSSAGTLGQGGSNYPIIFGSLPSSVVSAFVMEPEDELVLGIDAGISMLPASGASMTSLISAGVNAGTDLGFYSGTAGNVSFGCMSGSFMKILTGQASITLFGSQMKRDQELLGSSNQGLTSNAVHESIGDARVADQIDTPQRHELSGSYVDRLIFGDATANQNLLNLSNQVVIDNGGRFNQINEGATFRTARSVVSLYSKDRTGIHVSSLNDVKVRSPDQDMFNGYPPAFSGRDQTIYQFFVGGSANLGTNDFESDPFFVTPKKAAVLANTNIVSLQRFITIPFVGETYYDSMAPEITKWAETVGASMGSTPAVRLSFNKSNTGIPIVKIWAGNQEKIGVYPYQGNPPREHSQKVIAQIVPNSGSDKSFTVTAPHFIQIPAQRALPGFDASRLVLMTLFNRGFRYTNIDFDTTSNIRGYFYNDTGSFGPRYGMISPTVQKPTAVFRRDRFGQFRDMLEQSRDTKFFVNNPTLQKGAEVGDSPVQVRFVDSSDGKTIVDPFTTSCFNCSNESTSSVPYSDIGPSYVPPGEDGDVVTLNGTLFEVQQPEVSVSDTTFTFATRKT